MMPHKILFAIHDWGLGHATRDLVVIRALLNAGHQVGIVSYGRALVLMRSIFSDRCSFHEFKDIPKPLGRHPAIFYLGMSLSMPQVFWTFRRERLLAQYLCKTHGYDRIISDSRFGIALTEVPSYYLLHSLRQIIPGRPRWLEYFVERSQQHLLQRARAILVPDEERNGGLAGDLCHNMACDWGQQVKYIGLLSDARLLNVEQDLRCFISVSGAEPQRAILENIVLQQVQKLEGRVVVALGRPETPGKVYDDGQITIYGFLERDEQIQMMNRAKVVVTRSGYTTLMELSQIGRKALLIPTVGQSEQEYLAEYHRQRGSVHSIAQSELNLPRDVAIAESLPGLPRMASSEASVRRLMSIVFDSPKLIQLTPQTHPLT
ncbi:MAG: glycosyltransferase [Candidatus Nitrosoglobus sp.]